MRFESTPNPNAHAASGRIAPHAAETMVSRGDWIRTSDLPAPSRMRYQAAPRPESRWRELNPSPSAWKADVQATTPHRRRGECIGGPGRAGYEHVSVSDRKVVRCDGAAGAAKRSH